MVELKKAREAGSAYSVDIVEIELTRQPLIIERAGEPIAAIVSFDEYRRFSAWQDERTARRMSVSEQDPHRQLSSEQWRAHFETMDRFSARFDEVPLEELEAEIAGAIAAVRTDETPRDKKSR